MSYNMLSLTYEVCGGERGGGIDVAGETVHLRPNNKKFSINYRAVYSLFGSQLVLKSVENLLIS